MKENITSSCTNVTKLLTSNTNFYYFASWLPLPCYYTCWPFSFTVLFEVPSDWFSSSCLHLFKHNIFMEKKKVRPRLCPFSNTKQPLPPLPQLATLVSLHSYLLPKSSVLSVMDAGMWAIQMKWPHQNNITRNINLRGT